MRAKGIPDGESELGGQKVFVKTVAQEGVLQDVRVNKGEAEVLCGSIRIRVLIKDLALPVERKETPKEKIPKWKKRLTQEKSNVSVSKTLQPRPVFLHEINVIGQTVAEALVEVQAFIDSAVLSNLEEVRIVHGVGTGKLRAGIHEYLRKHKNVAEFRLGRYGEGETGVTIVKIK
jgi:DNA mismatch repair protein MutS2